MIEPALKNAILIFFEIKNPANISSQGEALPCVKEKTRILYFQDKTAIRFH